ncbi:MAG: hypothetical protein QOD99_1350, partial [Chthoniobacter sp.]|nr:hypothetical protein [Chthoniobacter sp.]
AGAQADFDKAATDPRAAKAAEMKLKKAEAEVKTLEQDYATLCASAGNTATPATGQRE